MSEQGQKKGCGCFEWIIIGIAVVVLFIFLGSCLIHPGHNRAKPRQTTCTQQVRLIATAIQMYVQDNNGQYPGANWTKAIDKYTGSPKMYYCPSDSAGDKASPISYGYGGLLVRTDGTGVLEDAVKAPTEVGAVADATPSRRWADGGGLIGGGGLSSARAVTLDPTRHIGTIVGFCDGHAKYFPGKQLFLKQIDNPVSRAFYQGIGLGLIANYGGGLAEVPVVPSKKTLTLGGDPAGMPLLRAAADVWTAQGGKVAYPATPDTDSVWVDASDSGTGTPIAQDALVVIVSRNCKIDGFPPEDVPVAQLPGYFSRGYAMATTDHLQVYTYPAGDGDRRYFTRHLRAWGAAPGREFGARSVPVTNELKMVDAVAADPYGLGYCSSAAADTRKVRILMLVRNGQPHIFPNENQKYRWVVPDTAAECRYPLLRTLRVRATGDGQRFLPIFANAKFQQGPLFMTSYWRP